jgi:signal transduction histidine kinase
MGLKKILDSIAFRISVTIALVIAASMIAVGGLILKEEKKILETELQNKGRNLAEIMSHHIIEPFLYEERHNMFSLLRESMIGKENIIVFAEVYDKNGEAIVTVYKDERFRKMQLPPYDFENPIDDIYIQEDKSLPIYYISLPISIEKYRAIGFIRMCITKEFLYNTLKSIKQKIYLLAAAVTFIGIMLGLYMARKVLKPILILSKGVRRVGEGEVGVEIPVVGEGEIKELALSFNKMSRKLKELIDDIKAAQGNLVRTEKLYAIGEFSAGVAHEIRNPLSSIKMLIQALESKKQAISSKNFAIIQGEIDRIDRIIKGFLAFTRPEKTEKKDVNINDILKEVITLTRPKMEQSSIHLKENLSSDLPTIKGNNDSLKQVFINLVLNAIQAMDEEGGTLSIETATYNGNLSTIIKDTGVGIPEKNLKTIFDPFFTTKDDGTGMGLALTYNIVNSHSGKIDIKSTPKIGTTIKVELPL